ncbi:hypothetical protein [Streptomyces sp. URMC 125]|uniref:hypothetical protein n=1 Tax=Streptomyces sp. URMC 125 TaxID=3423419 RepID=UPI003F1B86E8
MRALLDVAGLDGVSDAVRLAVVVLASRTPSESGVVEIRTSELGRWLGLSASYVASEVVLGLRRSGVVTVEAAEGEYGQNAGLECRVLPLWAAQDVAGHPLNLAKKELATLLRLLEAVMAPGWTHRDGSVTPAGLIGERTGRGAATDRLALLLLVLEARETGRVRQCGGTVDTKRGRAAATVARLLGCSAAAGERVLERLEDRELVLRVRLKTSSGMPNRSRLMVPAVATAHGRTVANDIQEDRAEALEPEFSDPDVTAGPVQAPEPVVELQVSSVPVTDEADVAEPDVAATLHTHHSPVIADVEEVEVDGGFSGEAASGFCRQPGRAGAREDGALRAEPPTHSPLSRSITRQVPQVARLLAAIVSKVNGWQRSRLDKLVGGLLADGEDDAMIATRLRSRLAPLATGNPAQPHRFRRDGLSWALTIGLPYTPGGMTPMPCRVRGCRNLVLARPTDRVRCDGCEIAALQTAAGDTAAPLGAPWKDPEEVSPPPPLEVLLAQLAPLGSDIEDQEQTEPREQEQVVLHSSGESQAGPAEASTRTDAEVSVELPAVVREQLAVIAAADPTAAQRAETAAQALYRPVGDESPSRYRDRVSAASAVFSTILERHADLLAAHYAGNAA